jgi:hypothetical protein
MQRVGVECYMCNRVARKTYDEQLHPTIYEKPNFIAASQEPTAQAAPEIHK